jgi:hypothetical protein
MTNLQNISELDMVYDTTTNLMCYADPFDDLIERLT